MNWTHLLDCAFFAALFGISLNRNESKLVRFAFLVGAIGVLYRVTL